MAVDQIKLSCPFKDFRNVQILGDLGVKVRILFITSVDHRVQLGCGYRISGCEQRDVPPARDKTFRDVAGDRFPRSILPRRCSPSDRRQDRDAFSTDSGLIDHREPVSGIIAARTSST